MKSIFDLAKINELINLYDGNRSAIFPYIKEKFMNQLMANPKSGLHEGEECFFMEFSFFENDYYQIKRDLLMNNINRPIVDIGCQLGLQSELFLDMEYIGIEHQSAVLLNEGLSNVHYLKELFPCKNLDISDKVVISNMSLGYFNCYLDKNCNSKKDALDEVDFKFLKELSKAQVLYCNSRPIFIEELKKYFKNHEFLNDKLTKMYRTDGISTGVYKFYN